MPTRPTPFGTATLVDANEIAAFMGCSPKHVRRLAEQGRFPKAVRVGRLHRWPRQAIEQWLTEQVYPIKQKNQQDPTPEEYRNEQA